MVVLFFAAGTQAFEHVVYRVDGESFGQFYRRDRYSLETIHLLACHAVEVDVHVVYRAFVLAVANLVFHYSAAVLHRMDEVAGEQERQYAQDARFFESRYARFQFRKTQGPGAGKQLPKYHYPVRGRAHSIFEQQMVESVCFRIQSFAEVYNG